MTILPPGTIVMFEEAEYQTGGRTTLRTGVVLQPHGNLGPEKRFVICAVTNEASNIPAIELAEVDFGNVDISTVPGRRLLDYRTGNLQPARTVAERPVKAGPSGLTRFRP